MLKTNNPLSTFLEELFNEESICVRNIIEHYHQYY